MKTYKKNEMSRAKRVKEQKDGEKSYEIVKRGKMQQEIEKMQISFIKQISQA